MLAVVLAILAAPLEVRLPAGGLCPDAKVVGGAVVIAYGDGKNGWLARYGSDRRVRINSVDGTVHAAGERGPKIASGAGGIYAAWQGDYRQGAHVWFARSGDGQSFEPQRDLLDGKTPGLDEVAIAARGDSVAVLWFDGRAPKDENAPVTSTIWYSLSSDGGKTFGPNRMMDTGGKLRACACCTFQAWFEGADRLAVVYRSGIANERDVYLAEGSPSGNLWSVRPLTQTHWKFEGCPMDGPRKAGSRLAFAVDGKCYVDANLLGPGKYADVSPSGIATWQSGSTLNWKDLRSGAAGSFVAGAGRAALAELPDGRTLVIRG